MGPRRDAAGDLHVNGPFLDPARRDRAIHPLDQPFQVVRREIELLEASLQPREMLGLEPAPSPVHPEDLVDGVAKQETAVPDRHASLLDGMISPLRQARTSIGGNPFRWELEATGRASGTPKAPGRAKGTLADFVPG